MKAFEFPAILGNPCFPNRAAALQFWARHRWRGVRLRLRDDPGCLFDWLALAVIAAGVLMLIQA